MNGTIYFRADHELVGRVLAAKLKERATPLPEPEAPLFAEQFQFADARAELPEPRVSWGERVRAWLRGRM